MVQVLDAAKAIQSIRAVAGSGRWAVLQAAADSIAAVGAPYTSVYMYMLDEGAEWLLLEAFCGRETEHKRIKVGHGVCGSAVSQGRDLNVGDVNQQSNYIACNAFTKSELVVLIRDKRSGRVLGQIDVDSDELNPFSEQEEAELKLVADAIAELISA